MDQEGKYNLSQARFKKDRKQWALNVFRLHILVIILRVWVPFYTINAQEAYIVAGLLSYARRYWRKSLRRRNPTDIARRLIAILKPHPRRARPSCRRGNCRGLEMPGQSLTVQVTGVMGPAAEPHVNAYCHTVICPYMSHAQAVYVCIHMDTLQ